MPLHQPGSDLERILAYGGANSGKTTAWLGIADMAYKTKSDAHFWVIDNDNATSRVIANPRGSFHHLHETNTTIWVPRTFDEYEGINETILSEAQPDDWIIIDMLSNVWEGMPDWWHQNVYGESPWDYWKAVRKEALSEGGEKGFGGEKAGVDWQYIGKTYRAWEKPLTIYQPCHVFATSAESEVITMYDKTGENAARYAIANGFQPKTEKGVYHRFHTVLRFRNTVSGQGRKKVYTRKVTMVKDRDREDIWEEELDGGSTLELSEGPKFVSDVMMRMWDWKLGKVS